MRMERTVLRMGNEGQLIYGMEITTYYQKQNQSRLKSFQSIFYSYVVPLLSMIYIASSVSFLILSKHEKPHMPLRAWIFGIVSGAVATLSLLVWYLVYYIWFSKMLSTYDLEMILDGKSPITGCDLHAIRLCTRAETPLEWLKFAVICFRWIWLIIGCIWIWKESLYRSDAPRLFLLCMSLAISSGVECTTQLLICCTGCYYHL